MNIKNSSEDPTTANSALLSKKFLASRGVVEALTLLLLGLRQKRVVVDVVCALSHDIDTSQESRVWNLELFSHFLCIKVSFEDDF